MGALTHIVACNGLHRDDLGNRGASSTTSGWISRGTLTETKQEANTYKTPKLIQRRRPSCSLKFIAAREMIHQGMTASAMSARPDQTIRPEGLASSRGGRVERLARLRKERLTSCPAIVRDNDVSVPACAFDVWVPHLLGGVTLNPHEDGGNV